ncbi:unnamed protein product [Ambrosiozyma monospora]|uniref:Unnamed protein product n=1 Tax=Ambrosiozyma monospora TaxID=43982 RepID=A0ACB5SUY8_AMBMO|nr:unnamed protein product [Ambrosiozyma monospora]
MTIIVDLGLPNVPHCVLFHLELVKPVSKINSVDEPHSDTDFNPNSHTNKTNTDRVANEVSKNLGLHFKNCYQTALFYEKFDIKGTD